MPSGVFHLGYLIPVGKQDLEADDLKQQAKPGSYGFMIDDFGPKLFRYMQNRNEAAATLGTVMSRVGDLNGGLQVSASVGTTTSMTNSGSLGVTNSVTGGAGFTSSAQIGSWLYVRSNTDSAGAAPEREIGVVAANTSVRVSLDSGRPFSTPIAVSDVLDVFGNWNVRGAFVNDTAFTAFGFVVGQNGVTDNNFGWAQTWGLVNSARFTSASTQVAFPLVISSLSGQCKQATAGTAANLCIGYSPMIIAALAAATPTGAPAFVQLDFGMNLMTATGALL
mgnify:CR=1 FL=1